ncbi:MAG: hypothetical protein IKE42_07910 [Aquamicrobium sp.]|jgi:cation transporter-like permease|uniref:hypothetical protein n=1 Tax=Mesorhizobium sp. Pch-S TaxID=2082387 RepID=UPI001011FEDC|nr:hypothetical protein [Mesorhizobium sp. Pch-S]MBR2687764.1 hypothetical protein [Aquamicrobium sp.]QAZ45415.1 hypothetical protein C1M53_23210 [Mesorhizobium sp. Pch-S]
MNRILTPYSLFGVAAATLLLSAKLLISVGVIHWVVAALLDLPLLPQLVLAGILAVPTLVLIWRIVWLCYEAETSPENN